MHAVGIQRLVTRVSQFISRQGVEFGAQRNRGQPRVSGDTADDSAAAAGIAVGDAQGFEFRDDFLGRFDFFEGQLRMLVQPAPEFNGVLMPGFGTARPCSGVLVYMRRC